MKSEMNCCNLLPCCYPGKSGKSLSGRLENNTLKYKQERPVYEDMLEINFLCIFTTIKRGIILNRIQLFGKDKNIKYDNKREI